MDRKRILRAILEVCLYLVVLFVAFAAFVGVMFLTDLWTPALPMAMVVAFVVAIVAKYRMLGE